MGCTQEPYRDSKYIEKMNKLYILEKTNNNK